MRDPRVQVYLESLEIDVQAPSQNYVFFPAEIEFYLYNSDQDSLKLWKIWSAPRKALHCSDCCRIATCLILLRLL